MPEDHPAAAHPAAPTAHGATRAAPCIRPGLSLLVSYAPWRWMLFANVPIGAAAPQTGPVAAGHPDVSTSKGH